MALTKVTASIVDLDGGIVINESSADSDFRGEANSNTHMLFVAGGNDRVGINSTSPQTKFVVQHTDGQNGIEFSMGSSENYIQSYNRNTNDYSDLSIAGETLRFRTNDNSERMRITSAGRLGLGTTSPSQPLHIATSNSGGYLFMDDGANGGLQVKATTSEVVMEFVTTGFGAFETADLRANIFVFKNSGTNEIARIDGEHFSHTHAAAAHTNGIKIINSQAGGYGSALTFRSERSDNNVITDAGQIMTQGHNSWNSDGTTSSSMVFSVMRENSLLEAMRILSPGDVVIGNTTVNPASAHSDQRGFAYDASLGTLEVAAIGGHAAVFGLNQAGSTDIVVFRKQGTQRGSITISDSGSTYNTSSDARLKTVLGKAEGLEIVNKLNPVNFEWNESKEIQDGLIAQEVMEIIPHAVSKNSDGYYEMDYSRVVTPLIKAIQEQQKEIEELKQNSHAPKTIEEMKGYEDLINRIKELENK